MSSGSDLAGVSDISDVSDSSGAAEPSGASVLPERSDPAGMADPMGELGAGLSANSPDLFMWGWIGFIFIYPFIVLIVWLIRREIDRACELSCDAAVVRGMNGEGRKRYCKKIITVRSFRFPDPGYAKNTRKHDKILGTTGINNTAQR